MKEPNDYVHLKITDFGLSRIQSKEGELMTGSAGTFVYLFSIGWHQKSLRIKIIQ